MIEISLATLNDLDFLIDLEKKCFIEERRSNEDSIKRSILSDNQSVYILKDNNINKASAITFNYKNSIRLYSIAVLPQYQEESLGRKLLNYIIEYAKNNYYEKITLEADFNQKRLTSWYESFGFKAYQILPHFYGKNEPALKMVLSLREKNNKLMNLIVTDQKIDWLNKIPNIEVTSPEKFINNKKYKVDDYRVFNLCMSYKYQSIGYYVSLLSSARELRVIPNAITIEDFNDSAITESIGDEQRDLIKTTFKKNVEDKIELNVYFGKTGNLKYKNLARTLYKLFPHLFLKFTFEKDKNWKLTKVSPIELDNIVVDDNFISYAKEYFNQKRFSSSEFKNYKYDLAILIDHNDLTAPSSNVSLTKFKYAAEKIGFYTEFITKEDYHRINQFDALFIRATTNVNDYTYQFSRLAYSEGLIVIDDPWSILKCANKLYLHESMEKHNILTPKTFHLTKNTNLDDLINNLKFPIILKRPDSAASLGVVKVNNKEELIIKGEELFINSEIIIAQEYLKTEFDWRVGVLDNKAIFVARYYMAKNHWQIYNWNKNKDSAKYGKVETLSVENAPKRIIKAALKATEVIGDGFYGVDLKEVSSKIYVIEVNDNPSVDHDVEDKVLGDELYFIIMRHILNKIEQARNVKKRKLYPTIE